ncbi:MAG TPA: hypothetical protein VHE35_04975 [Kofleriaceae bacterium]|nr:hypothetical protein [Kofleriaceae bacterium]
MRSAAALLVALAACGGGGGAAGKPTTIGNSAGGGTPAGSGLALGEPTTIEIHDTWSGLGCAHDFSAKLEARGGAFTGDARLQTGWDSDRDETKTVSVPAKVVASLAAAVDDAKAKRAAAPADGSASASVTSWTDDYPSGSMTFTGPSGAYKLEFTDQHRKLQWSHGSESVPLDSDQDILGEGKPSAIWEAYMAVLDSAGMSKWIDDLCKR